MGPPPTPPIGSSNPPPMTAPPPMGGMMHGGGGMRPQCPQPPPMSNTATSAMTSHGMNMMAAPPAPQHHHMSSLSTGAPPLSNAPPMGLMSAGGMGMGMGGGVRPPQAPMGGFAASPPMSGGYVPNAPPQTSPFPTVVAASVAPEAPPLQPGPSTAPTAAATPIKPGMPVPWPIPTTSQQMSSTTASTAEANRLIQSASKPAPPATPMPHAEVEFIKRVLENALEGVNQREPNPSVHDEQIRRVADLITKLTVGQVNPEVQQKVLKFAQALDTGDSRTAKQIQMDLTTTGEWGQHKMWLVGLKRLIPR
eukprot:Platyproteum_vivax@DN8385_c0_g1_i1.p1